MGLCCWHALIQFGPRICRNILSSIFHYIFLSIDRDRPVLHFFGLDVRLISAPRLLYSNSNVLATLTLLVRSGLGHTRLASQC